MGIKKILKKTGEWLSQFAEPNEEQRKRLEEKKEEFLKEKSEEECVDAHLDAISIEVFHSYLPKINELYQPSAPLSEEYNVNSFNITRWVTDPRENSIEKLSNVYQSFVGEDCTLALIYDRKKNGCNVTFAVSFPGQPELGAMLSPRLQNALKGNFPGVECTECKKSKNFSLAADPEKMLPAIAAVSNLASDKSEKFISQSIEKVLDGVVPKRDDGMDTYRLVLLAKPVKDVHPYMDHLYEQYSRISPFAQIQKQFSLTEAMNVMNGTTLNLGGSYIGSLGFGKNWITGEQVGVNNGTTTTYTAYAVKHTMELIEAQMKRLQQCQALGMWDFAAYVVSNDYSTAVNVAHMYTALTQGTDSFLEQSAINVWNGSSDEGKEDAKKVLSFLTSLQHPEFSLKDSSTGEKLLYPFFVDATTMLSGSELARAFNFPQKSVPGLPVIKCAEFGRNVICKDGEIPSDIELGCIYHMHSEEKNSRVCLGKEELKSHTFITGTTGAGKSNTIYQILNELKKEKVKFLVIEPAKGEYKKVFGDANVYGTHPEKGSLLRINPFAFPEHIHIYEHIDRLTEIFNVCWPMYAAMPAVLKDAIIRAYKIAGWDLRKSTNKHRIFPTFEDVLRQIDIVMNESQYSADSKGDYKGALSTRLHSLTTGLNGMIFCSDDLSDKELFESDVIVDLSRVGAAETKALIMGFLVMRLQEYRLNEKGENKPLEHVTVLEEAHHLLKRTSMEQSSESANLAGKSVEMLTNAIAEMRTYGEGFILADQSPGLLDMAAIRNTNTKIILRLPEYSDRLIVGKACGFNDDQIDELAKLGKGVAAAYQNEWIEGVLCKINEFKDKKPYAPSQDKHQSADIKASLVDCFISKELGRLKELSDPIDKIVKAELPASVKRKLLAYRDGESDEHNTAASIAYDLFCAERLFTDIQDSTEIKGRWNYLCRKLGEQLDSRSIEQVETILYLIVYWHALQTQKDEIGRLFNYAVEAYHIKEREVLG